MNLAFICLLFFSKTIPPVIKTKPPAMKKTDFSSKSQNQSKYFATKKTANQNIPKLTKLISYRLYHKYKNNKVKPAKRRLKIKT